MNFNILVIAHVLPIANISICIYSLICVNDKCSIVINC